MSKEIIFDNSLTKEEIQTNTYWVLYIQKEFPEFNLAFQESKYKQIYIPSKIFSIFPELGNFLRFSRSYLLNHYFISKKSNLDWDQIQGKLKIKDNNLLIWMDKISILRTNSFLPLMVRLNFLKDPKKTDYLLKQKSSNSNEELITKILRICSNIKIPEKNNDVIKKNITERIKFVDALLESHYNLLNKLYELEIYEFE